MKRDTSKEGEVFPTQQSIQRHSHLIYDKGPKPLNGCTKTLQETLWRQRTVAKGKGTQGGWWRCTWLSAHVTVCEHLGALI